MKNDTEIAVACSDEVLDYYQGGYDDTKALLIKFLKKEGIIMTVRKVKAGFEAIYENLVTMKAQLEEEIRRMVAEKSADIDKMIGDCTYEEEVVEPEVDSAPLEEEVTAE